MGQQQKGLKIYNINLKKKKNVIMKNRILLFAIMLTTTVYFSSCSKDENVNSLVQQAKNKDIQLMRSEKNTTEAKIIKFFKRMNIVREDPNNSEAENWNYSADSTVWYIEAALNYKYAYKWQYKGSANHSDLYNTDSSFVNMSANNETGDYNIIALQISYDIFAVKLENQYEKTDADSKFFVMSDVVLNNYDNNSLSLVQYSVIGKANQLIPQSGWIWGLGMGDCSGGHRGIDATYIIENKLINSRAIHVSPEGYWGFVNIGAIDNGNNGWIFPFDVPLPNGVTNPTPFANYLLFYADKEPNDPDPCISNSNIAWYANNILSIEASNKPVNKEIVYTDIKSTITGSRPIYGLIHQMKPSYGESVFFAHIIPID